MSPHLAPAERGGPWTVDDLARFPKDGQRYEIFEGSLVVSPMAALPHGRVVYRLRRLLERHAPAGLAVVERVGLYVSEINYYVPDLQIVPERALDAPGKGLRPRDVGLVIEVVSPTSGVADHVTKRHAYAVAGVPRYWVVDPGAEEISVLDLADRAYRRTAVVPVGKTWTAAEPFSVTLDPAELF